MHSLAQTVCFVLKNFVAADARAAWQAYQALLAHMQLIAQR
jgi:hypothetical protein